MINLYKKEIEQSGFTVNITKEEAGVIVYIDDLRHFCRTDEEVIEYLSGVWSGILLLSHKQIMEKIQKYNKKVETAESLRRIKK